MRSSWTRTFAIVAFAPLAIPMTATTARADEIPAGTTALGAVP